MVPNPMRYSNGLLVGTYRIGHIPKGIWVSRKGYRRRKAFFVWLKINFKYMNIFKASDFTPIWIVMGLTLVAIVLAITVRIFLKKMSGKLKDKIKNKKI
jgi:hypothetical protein